MKRWFALVLVVCLAGCGSSGPTLNPVAGSCTYDGKPCEGATVVFQPVGGGAGSLAPSGTVGADGSFTIATHPHGAGAPAGEYAVVVTWYPPDARSQANPKNKLPAKYADAKTTPVPKVTVKSGPNDPLTLALTK